MHKLIDETCSHINALNNLNEPTEHWDTLLVHIVSSHFDFFTRQEWEKYAAAIEKPTFDNIKVFARERCRVLEALAANKQVQSTTSNKEFNKNRPVKSTVNTSQAYIAVSTTNCPICKQSHGIFKCEEFQKMSVSQRIRELKAHSCCLNCLRGDHLIKDCKSRGCRKCGKRHNTLIHFEANQPESIDNGKQAEITKLELTSQLTSSQTLQ